VFGALSPFAIDDKPDCRPILIAIWSLELAHFITFAAQRDQALDAHSERPDRYGRDVETITSASLPRTR